MFLYQNQIFTLEFNKGILMKSNNATEEEVLGLFFQCTSLVYTSSWLHCGIAVCHINWPTVMIILIWYQSTGTADFIFLYHMRKSSADQVEDKMGYKNQICQM